ncbi:MAG TPA: radical SAM protein [Gemmatimonadales bacterium]|nr:radical SAM protein [Gemmatimonadales bacterium]
MHELHRLRLGPLRVTAAQLSLLAGEESPDVAPWTPLAPPLRNTEFLALPVRSVLNPPAATGMNFWSLNPYVGCEFGCAYCYARDTHRYAVERAHRVPSGVPAWLDFERRILVKADAAAVLARTLNPQRLGGKSIVIGTATDPYQPAERRFRITRALLERLLPHRGLSVGIITKSPLVTRDLDLLTRLAAQNDVSVNVSLTSLDAKLLRRIESRSPVPRARLRALRRLTDAGIHAGLLVAPILPCLTDGTAQLSALLLAAKEAGARYVVGAALRLNPAARRRFLPFLAREFPELAERYERHYARRASAGWKYHDAVMTRLQVLQRRHGFPLSEGMRRRRQIDGTAA